MKYLRGSYTGAYKYKAQISPNLSSIITMENRKKPKKLKNNNNINSLIINYLQILALLYAKLVCRNYVLWYIFASKYQISILFTSEYLKL